MKKLIMFTLDSKNRIALLLERLCEKNTKTTNFDQHQQQKTTNF